MALTTVNDSIDGSFLPHRPRSDLSKTEIIALIREHGRFVADFHASAAWDDRDDLRALRPKLARLAELADLFEEAIAPQS